MPSASQSAWASDRAMSARLLSAPTDTMGITRMPARRTATTVLATSPVASSLELARGSMVDSVDVDSGAGSTVAVVALTVAGSQDAAQSAASTAVLRT